MSARKEIKRSRGVEHVIYSFIWLFVLSFPLINESLMAAEGHEFQWVRVFRWWIGTLPFLMMFVLHNVVLLPYCLQDGRIRMYIVLVLVLMSVFTISEYFYFDYKIRNDIFAPPPPGPSQNHQSLPPKPPLRPDGIPLPHVLNLLLGVLMLGFNLAVFLLFKYQRSQAEKKSLLNMKLQAELKYLKTQIKPHFFMNMLNNIHAMVETDPVKAQDMILELSKLMRYVLYEGENSMTSLGSEVRFISCYVELMRQRYPADKVDVTLSVPDNPTEVASLPPLLFIAFVENAFKHGISFMRRSRIEVIIEEDDGYIRFFCRNTKPNAISENNTPGGVGLENVKRRLDLLYGSRATLNIEETSKIYTVELKIPHL